MKFRSRSRGFSRRFRSSRRSGRRSRSSRSYFVSRGGIRL